MRLFKVKIKSTGMVFLGPILGAFVEQDDKSFKKKKNSEQMTILGAGVFANLLFALIFYGLYVAFFFSSFAASGYIFNSYAVSVVPLANVDSIVNISDGLIQIVTTDGNYYLDAGLSVQLAQNNGEYLIAYTEAPAVLAQMKGAIVQADDIKITGQESLREFLQNKNPGDSVVFTTEVNEGIQEYEIVLGEHPENSSLAYVGVGHNVASRSGVIQNLLGKFMDFKESSTLYKPTWDGEFVYFVFHLLWWVMIINLIVALFNMLPLGMLDGGRFFELLVLSITRSEKFAKRAYKFMGWLILLVFVLMMFLWFVGIF